MKAPTAVSRSMVTGSIFVPISASKNRVTLPPPLSSYRASQPRFWVGLAALLAIYQRGVVHVEAEIWMLSMRDRIAKRSPLSFAEFATLRLRLIKIAARVIEAAARIRVFLPTARPDRAVFCQLAGRLCAARTLSGTALSPYRAHRRNLQPRKIESITRLVRLRRDRGTVPGVKNHAASEQLRHIR